MIFDLSLKFCQFIIW